MTDSNRSNKSCENCDNEYKQNRNPFCSECDKDTLSGFIPLKQPKQSTPCDTTVSKMESVEQKFVEWKNNYKGVSIIEDNRVNFDKLLILIKDAYKAGYEQAIKDAVTKRSEEDKED